MKNLKLISLKTIFILFISVIQINKTSAQDTVPTTDQSELKNEIKLNLAYAPFGYLEATYERILPGNSSAGLAFGKSIKKEININYHLFAFYRLFFGRGSGKGFFIEANGAFWKEDNTFHGVDTSKGIGLAVGGKFFRGERFHGEFVFGYGRSFSDNFSDFSEAYPRFGISIGHRF